MRRKRKIAPFFQTHPPFNPITGEYASLSGEQGVSPYCALMQVAADDTYTDYVICRGFDTRMLVFIDYEAGNPDKPGISVAKPYGNRKTGVYKIGEIYPALLPTQGNATYMPPSPSEINFRLGQNPGVAITNAEANGQPSDLTSFVSPMIDHNGLFVNWLLINSGEPDNEPCEDIQPGAYQAICAQTIAPGDTGIITITSCVNPVLVSAVNHTNCTFYSGERITAHVDNCCEVTFTGCKCDCTEPVDNCCDKLVFICVDGRTYPVRMNDFIVFGFGIFDQYFTSFPINPSDCCVECEPIEGYTPYSSWVLISLTCNEDTITALATYWCQYHKDGTVSEGGPFQLKTETYDWSALCGESPVSSITETFEYLGCSFDIVASFDPTTSCARCGGDVPGPTGCCSESRWVCVNGDSRQMDFDGGDETWDVSTCCPDCTSATLRLRMTCSNGVVSLQRTYTCDGVSSIQTTNISSLCTSTAPLSIQVPTPNCFLTAIISAADLPCDSCDSCCDETRWFCINDISKELTLSGDTDTFDVADCCDCETSVLTITTSCIGLTNTIRIDWSITCTGLEAVSGVEFIACDATVLNISVNDCLYQVQVSTTNIGCEACSFGPTPTTPPPP
jgi:hypothetical protein